MTPHDNLANLKIKNIHFSNVTLSPLFNKNHVHYNIKRNTSKLYFHILFNYKPDAISNEYKDIKIYIKINNLEPIIIKPSIDEDHLIENIIDIPNTAGLLKFSIIPSNNDIIINLPVYIFHFNELPQQSIGPGTICNHEQTEVYEGEVWGGCSGTCQIEFFNVCLRCKITLKRWIEHRD